MFFHTLDMLISATVFGFGASLGFLILWVLVFFGCDLYERVERRTKRYWDQK